MTARVAAERIGDERVARGGNALFRGLWAARNRRNFQP